MDTSSEKHPGDYIDTSGLLGKTLRLKTYAFDWQEVDETDPLYQELANTFKRFRVLTHNQISSEVSGGPCLYIHLDEDGVIIKTVWR